MTEEQSFNPKLKAIVTIRHWVAGLKTNWAEIERLGTKLDNTLSEQQSLFLSEAPSDAREEWKRTMIELEAHVSELRAIVDTVRAKIANRDASNMVETWEAYRGHADRVRESLVVLEQLGADVLSGDLDAWRGLCTMAREEQAELLAQAEACTMQLRLIEQFAPEQVDKLTDVVLRHIPENYTVEEAAKYEADYLEALDEIRREATGEKNLWDKFLDVLAGGAQQTPSERVMMKRWLDGERGDLS